MNGHTFDFDSQSFTRRTLSGATTHLFCLFRSCRFRMPKPITVQNLPLLNYIFLIAALRQIDSSEGRHLICSSACHFWQRKFNEKNLIFHPIAFTQPHGPPGTAAKPRFLSSIYIRTAPHVLRPFRSLCALRTSI
jgi:hypothetical protein